MILISGETLLYLQDSCLAGKNEGCSEIRREGYDRSPPIGGDAGGARELSEDRIQFRPDRITNYRSRDPFDL